MSLTDKINDMITASEASAKCLRDAARDLPARIVSTVGESGEIRVAKHCTIGVDTCPGSGRTSKMLGS